MLRADTIKLIEKEDIPNLKYYKVNWDVELHGKPYQVIEVDGFVHTISSRYGENDYWAYPLDEELSYDNLVEFNGHRGACWGINYTESHYYSNKWDEREIGSSHIVQITRNGKVFIDCVDNLSKAIYYLEGGVINEHPLCLNRRDFDKDCIGRKVWYYSQPAIIESYVDGQACVILKPDGIDKFKTPAEFERDDLFDGIIDTDRVKEDIFSEHIWWFRD